MSIFVDKERMFEISARTTSDNFCHNERLKAKYEHTHTHKQNI